MDYKIGLYSIITVTDGEISHITEIIPGNKQLHSVYSPNYQKQFWIENEKKTLCYEAPFNIEAFDHLLVVTFKYLRSDLYFSPEFLDMMSSLNKDGKSYNSILPYVLKVKASMEKKLIKLEIEYKKKISYLENLVK